MQRPRDRAPWWQILRSLRFAAPNRTIFARLGEALGTYDLDGYRGVVEGAPVPAHLRVNEASHCCLRGPCVHFLEVRKPAKAQTIPNKFRTNLFTYCLELGEMHDPTMSQELIIKCTQWWPSTLAFVPPYVRPFLRETVRLLWEQGLIAQGYTFEWRQALHRWVQDGMEDRQRPFTTEDERRQFINEQQERRRRAIAEANAGDEVKANVEKTLGDGVTKVKVYDRSKDREAAAAAEVVVEAVLDAEPPVEVKPRVKVPQVRRKQVAQAKATTALPSMKETPAPAPPSARAKELSARMFGQGLADLEKKIEEAAAADNLDDSTVRSGADIEATKEPT